MVHAVGPGSSRCMQCIMLARGAQGSNLVNRGESLVLILFCGVRHAPSVRKYLSSKWIKRDVSRTKEIYPF